MNKPKSNEKNDQITDTQTKLAMNGVDRFLLI
jgi:hypothetical protein